MLTVPLTYILWVNPVVIILLVSKNSGQNPMKLLSVKMIYNLSVRTAPIDLVQ